MPETKIIVRGVEFVRQVFVRDDGTFVQVSNSLYGSTERRLNLPIDLEALSRHLAMELFRCGPKNVAALSPRKASREGYDPYDAGPKKDKG